MSAPQLLRPFAPKPGPQRVLQATAHVHRLEAQQALLDLHFVLQGLEDLSLPAPSSSPARCDGLWQHTCFEAFVADADQQQYWEFNLSPSGDWAVYRLSGYRENLQPEPLFGELPFALKQLAQSGGPVLSLELSCPLPAPLAGASQLQLGLTAVLESEGGELSYWALAHPGPEADFHDRRGWTLLL